MMTLGKDIEFLDPQTYENIAIIPLKTKLYYIDLITLKKGLELGLVEVKECETSQVNTVIVKNDAVTPLILIDGEEIIGGDQNRIINSTVLVNAKSKMKIPVSCTEKGRWSYKSEFKQSDYIANFNTRRAKEYASRNTGSFQNIIWSSISTLETENNFSSPTSAMEESYENLKKDHEKIIKELKIVPGQNGVLVIVNGEIKGFEIFLNTEIYKEFHEKILKSYIIDCENDNSTFAINIDAAKDIVQKAFDSTFEKRESTGLEDVFEFENSAGIGTLYQYKDKIIHLSYFTNIENNFEDEINENTVLKTDI